MVCPFSPNEIAIAIKLVTGCTNIEIAHKIYICLFPKKIDNSTNENENM